MTGIYCITHILTGRKYVGQSVEIENRLENHRFRSSCYRLAKAIERYGWSAFKAEMIEECGPMELRSREAAWIAALKPFYNDAGTRGYRGCPSKETVAIGMRFDRAI